MLKIRLLNLGVVREVQAKTTSGSIQKMRIFNQKVDLIILTDSKNLATMIFKYSGEPDAHFIEVVSLYIFESQVIPVNIHNLSKVFDRILLQ